MQIQAFDYLRVLAWQRRAQRGRLGSQQLLSVSAGGPQPQCRSVGSPSAASTHKHTPSAGSTHRVSPVSGRHEERGVSRMTQRSSSSWLIAFCRSTNWICEWVWHDLTAACILLQNVEDPNIVIWTAACISGDTSNSGIHLNWYKQFLWISVWPQIQWKLIRLVCSLGSFSLLSCCKIYTLNSFQ